MKFSKVQLDWFAIKEYNKFISRYSLKHALHIVKDLGKMLRQEQKRRKELEPIIKKLRKELK